MIKLQLSPINLSGTFDD